MFDFDGVNVLTNFIKYAKFDSDFHARVEVLPNLIPLFNLKFVFINLMCFLHFNLYKNV